MEKRARAYLSEVLVPESLNSVGVGDISGVEEKIDLARGDDLPKGGLGGGGEIAAAHVGDVDDNGRAGRGGIGANRA